MTFKTELRRRMLVVRRQCGLRLPQAGSAAADHFPPELVVRGQTAAAYRPSEGEFDAMPLVRRLLAAGLSIALPFAVERRSALTFRLWRPGDPLEADAFGIPSPSPLRGPASPDLVIVPVVAFDAAGNRLGQGAGCYDRTLAALRAKREVIAIGLAFAGQEVDRLEPEPHDQRLDAVLTEKGFRRFGPAFER